MVLSEGRDNIHGRYWGLSVLSYRSGRRPRALLRRYKRFPLRRNHFPAHTLRTDDKMRFIIGMILAYMTSAGSPLMARRHVKHQTKIMCELDHEPCNANPGVKECRHGPRGTPGKCGHRMRFKNLGDSKSYQTAPIVGTSSDIWGNEPR